MSNHTYAKDMSGTCNLEYETRAKDARSKDAKKVKAWKEWFDNHCGQCKYMKEICMYGEK